MRTRSIVVALLICSLSLIDVRADIVLPPPSAHDLGTFRAVSIPAAAAGRPAERVGFGRALQPSAAAIDGASLDWREAADGRFVARTEVVSPGAAALRLELKVRGTQGDARLRFESADGPVAGVWTLADVASLESFWSPIIEGERGTLVLEVASGGDAATVRLAVPRVSHIVTSLVRPSRAVADVRPKAEVVCHVAQEPLLAEAAKSVVKLAQTDSRGDTSTCTGTLIASGPASVDPLIFTAAHCGAPEATNVYWFFDTEDCAGQQAPRYVQLTRGVRQLAAHGADDWSILRLLDSVPDGARFATWRTEPMTAGTPGWLLHHPAGEAMKATSGRFSGYVTGIGDDFSGGGSMVRVDMDSSDIRGGSSGGGFFTRSTDGTRLELRGGLWGTEGSSAYFSRMDLALPLVRDLMTPAVGFPDGTVVVVEYWKGTGREAQQFVTAEPREIAALNAGVQIAGWSPRPGRFLAFAAGRQVDGSVPVCRFFNPIGQGAHFYSASEQECDDVTRRFGQWWVAETREAFRVFLPDLSTGACPPATTAVYRYFNPATGSHEFTADLLTVALHEMVFRGIQEGYGPARPNLVAMCAPSG